MDLNDKRVGKKFICLLIYSSIHHFTSFSHTCMFHPLKINILNNREIDGCVDRRINPMDEWREDVT